MFRFLFYVSEILCFQIAYWKTFYDGNFFGAVGMLAGFESLLLHFILYILSLERKWLEPNWSNSELLR